MCRSEKNVSILWMLPLGREERTTEVLRRVGVGDGLGIACGQNDGANVRGVAAVGSADGERVRPHLFVRQPVRADDARGAKFALELLHLPEGSQFQIDN